MRVVRKLLGLIKVAAVYGQIRRHADFILNHRKLHSAVLLTGLISVILVQIGVGCGKLDQDSSSSSSSTTPTGWSFVDGNGSAGINRNSSYDSQ